MKMLILGATGFLGRNLCDFFADKHEVTAHYHLRPPVFKTQKRWNAGELENFEACQRLVKGQDIILQFAAATTGCKDTLQTPWLHTSHNAVMNSYLMRAAVEAGVKHVIFPSCSVMYPNGVNNEETPPVVDNRYFGFAHTKLYCEKLCQFYAMNSDTKFTVLRNSNFYGAYDKFDLQHSHVFGATITKVMQAKDKITVWGTGEEARDFLHVSDLCRMVEALIKEQRNTYDIFCCGSGIPTTINDLVSKIIAESGKDLTIEHDLSAPTIPTSLSLDCSKAARELGWQPQISLEEGIHITMDWWQKNWKIHK